MKWPGRSSLRTVSLRRRVTIATVAVFTAALVVMTVVVDVSFTAIVDRSVNAVLDDHVQLAGQLAAQHTAPQVIIDRLETPSVRARLALADGRVFGGVPPRHDDGAVKTRNLRLPNASGPLAGARLTLEVDERLIAVTRSRLVHVLVIVAAIALIVIAIGVPIAVKRALSPLDAMTRLARGVAGGRRGERLWPEHGDTELGRTATAFDEMLNALEGAELRAVASEERMRRFVADAAHELRTPIAGVAAASEAVLQQPADGDLQTRQRLLLLLGREAQRASRLIDDLLDLARIDTGLILQRETTDLRALLDTQAERAQLLHPELSLRVEGQVVIAAVDAVRLGQVVANLLNNACAATPAGATVGIGLSRNVNGIEIAVRDAGPGVAEGDRDRIFERLVRLDTPSAVQTRGAGLGLPIARGIARAHGGDVICQTPVPGVTGAVFVLWLPDGGGRGL